MFDSSGLRDDFGTTKIDVSSLLNNTTEAFLDGSKSRAEAIADQIKAALGEVSEAVDGGWEHLDNLIADRPMATAASAFALGVVVGFMLRRH